MYEMIKCLFRHTLYGPNMSYLGSLAYRCAMIFWYLRFILNLNFNVT